MGMGIGKRYFVQALETIFGDFDTCVEYMNNHKPRNKYEFYELEPYPSFEEDGSAIVYEYRLSLLTGKKYRRK